MEGVGAERGVDVRRGGCVRVPDVVADDFCCEVA